MGFFDDMRAGRDEVERQMMTDMGMTDADIAAWNDPDALQTQLTLQQLQDLQQIYRPFIEQQQLNAFDPATVTKIQNDMIGAVDEGIAQAGERARNTTAQAYGATPTALTARQSSALDRRSALQTSQARGAGRQSALQQAQQLRQDTIA